MDPRNLITKNLSTKQDIKKTLVGDIGEGYDALKVGLGRVYNEFKGGELARQGMADIGARKAGEDIIRSAGRKAVKAGKYGAIGLGGYLAYRGLKNAILANKVKTKKSDGIENDLNKIGIPLRQQIRRGLRAAERLIGSRMTRKYPVSTQSLVDIYRHRANPARVAAVVSDVHARELGRKAMRRMGMAAISGLSAGIGYATGKNKKEK